MMINYCWFCVYTNMQTMWCTLTWIQLISIHFFLWVYWKRVGWWWNTKHSSISMDHKFDQKQAESAEGAAANIPFHMKQNKIKENVNRKQWGSETIVSIHRVFAVFFSHCLSPSCLFSILLAYFCKAILFSPFGKAIHKWSLRSSVFLEVPLNGPNAEHAKIANFDLKLQTKTEETKNKRMRRISFVKRTLKFNTHAQYEVKLTIGVKNWTIPNNGLSKL